MFSSQKLTWIKLWFCIIEVTWELGGWWGIQYGYFCFIWGSPPHFFPPLLLSQLESKLLRYWSIVCFSYNVFIWLCVILASQNELSQLPFFITFWKSLWGIGVYSCLNIWEISPVSLLGTGLFFVEFKKKITSIFLLDKGLFKLSVSSWVHFCS